MTPGEARKLFGNWCAWVPSDAESDWGVARVDGTSGPEDRRVLGGNPVPLDSRSNDGFHEGAY
jgi:hypothetical protein